MNILTPARKQHRLFADVAIVLFTYAFLYIWLHDDPRVATATEDQVLQALSIDPGVYAYRARRFNTYAETEHLRSGPGELGRGLDLHLPNDELDRVNELYGYNSHACKLIPLDRSLGNVPAKE